VAALGTGTPAVEVVDLLSASSFALTHRDLRLIEHEVRKQLRRPDVSGVVVTHGTDTLEETAALLALVHDDDRPVVLTGAQRPPDHPEPDGPANLRHAVAVAADPSMQRTGVLICFGGAVLSALGTTKMHTTALSAFGEVLGDAEAGCMDGGGNGQATPRLRPLTAPSAAFDQIRVPIITSHVGADGRQLDNAFADHAAGVVLVGTGLGNVTLPLLASVRRATAAGRPVAVSSRVGRGPLAPTYGNGGGHDLVAAGALLVPGLPPSQVRILMALVLSHGEEHPQPGSFHEVVADWVAYQSKRDGGIH
jgi:L-asparaginase